MPNVTTSRKELAQPKTDISKSYEPTPDESVAVKTVLARRKKTPHIKTSKKGGRVKLSLDHPNQVYGQALLMEVFATGDVDYLAEILSQLANASVQDGKVNERELNFMISVVKGIQPRDQLETMLAAQMAAIHSLTMDMASRLKVSTSFVDIDCIERTLNKLARTFAGHLDALKRYRSTGEQQVTVRHVTVNQGGQAIVGNVAHQGGGSGKKPRTTP